MERLQKVLAQAGVASRRKSEKLILDGLVKVNGKVITELGTKVSRMDTIEVEGVQLTKETPVYYLLYKPRGYISTVDDEKGRKTVMDLVPEVSQRIFPVGRLDYDTSGVLLMTNDGDFSYLMTHPKFEIKKKYVAKVKGIPSRDDLKKLETGIELDDGSTAPARVKMTSSDKKTNSAIVEITIHEGRNRQVRRMFDAINCPVQKLKREEFANLTTRGLNAGEARELTRHELKQLRVLAETGKIG
ncbi:MULTISPECIES: pseudouridine synthase [unclassified Sporosarcina]|uniref:pseudouridine synthase n=1 Tax=unclassified Sporosarcina TaxID=2647733 RepID=UPI000C16EDFB|nr:MULTISPECIES: pseudouridine synthase [unclassified Sporosarcina]PIC87755.1 pseudouridine synthase [Sporosarcina sp. P20a]PID00604.1 pseudouridine synthase [Sporosarcina sp. P29]PID06977.1 pseudouridine synthase [Sporosarcina sp. P30]PID10171.1 pseudouridine synthase [Sporosarcina sp. P31]PID13750.1 pseudouridine synthase [Sporosarcina sp. P32b]